MRIREIQRELGMLGEELDMLANTLTDERTDGIKEIATMHAIVGVLHDLVRLRSELGIPIQPRAEIVTDIVR